MKVIISILIAVLLPIGAGVQALAPVRDANTAYYAKKLSTHRVGRGETLYAIAKRYGIDYRNLAAINGLTVPYTLSIGERLRLPSSSKIKKPSKKHRRKIANLGIKRHRQLSKKLQRRKTPSRRKYWRPQKWPKRVVWTWPAKGKLERRFAPWKGSKGINIAGRGGSPVRAAASGRVAYAGHGLPGYGNLLIIKHNNLYLTAYAHNRKLLVKEGQWVKKGVKIAQMGKTGGRRVELHFEIRRRGKPVNPLRYLPRLGARS
jgi:lipoprotein NlpD